MPETSPTYHDADILVLDDNPVNVELLVSLLEDHGYHRVRGETDSRRLETLLHARLPDLLLLDIRMPHLDGYRVLELLKARWPAQAPPVIVLSAQSDADTRLRALHLGARDFLTKPFDQFEVLQRIHNVLEVHFLLRQRSSRAALLEELVDQRTAQLHRLSLTDPVTERPNRRALLERLQQQVAQAGQGTLYFIALEGMDDIARLHGYGVAEALSRAVGERLQQYLGRSGAVFGVWSSNEWLVLEFGVPGGFAGRAAALVELITRGFEVEQLLLHLGGRVGVSHTGFEYGSAERLVRLASMALPAENNGWQCYRPELEQQLLTLNRYRQALRAAADHRELFLVYQPKVELRGGRIVGAEALLRWINPELGFISPADFIPIAEASGEILRLGDWVIDAAIRQLERWLAQELVAPDFRLAVNVATLQLMQPGFADRLITRLRQSRLPRGALEVEVTESGLMRNVELALTQLRQLAAQGISIAIDDFGTGYSSLAYLKSMPVSVLKIDQAFVNQMDTDSQDRRLAETVIHLARNLGCATVAEGVERPEHIELLREMGCMMVQGYWYSPPLKPEAFIAYYRQHHAGGAD
ncbi:putative bifunctional diguanylate cyclase/phosphodiesterase [Zobellella sp. An-6]|uniref:putative bifunctional diguanylate cyclase/phosphodiesterase n=1 Tax=Zobellella sp. An-6 TaxID=3400218 RepID=UPI00404374EC